MAQRGTRKPKAKPDPAADAPTSMAGVGDEGQAPKKDVAAATKDTLAAIGAGVLLMGSTPTHKHFFLTDLEWALNPAIVLGQYKLWTKGPAPIALATWAFLGPEAEARIVEQGVRKLAPTDWKSGETLWLMDLIAPMQNQETLLTELRSQHPAFQGKKIKTLRPAPGGGMAVVEW